jgi:plastocyanin
MNHVIIIQDFDFKIHYLKVNIGDTVTFRLSDRVPFHAEHVIFGENSENHSLRFESELLQVSS